MGKITIHIFGFGQVVVKKNRKVPGLLIKNCM